MMDRVLDPATADVTLPPAEGVLYDLPAEEYHALDRISASGVPHILRSPDHYRHWRQSPAEPTEAMLLGTIIHMGVLEPKRFAEKLWVWEKPDGRAKADEKKAREEEHTAARIAGNLVVERETYKAAVQVVYAIQAHPAAAALLKHANTEVTMLWHEVNHGIGCKARLDAVNMAGPYKGIIVDVKSTRDASREAFRRSMAQHFYHAQAAMYWRAHESCLHASPQGFAWICAETDPPYGVAVYVIDTPSLMKGQADLERAMGIYARAVHTNRWPGYPLDVQPLGLPRWALRYDE
jgi:hypothetical protein